MLNQIEICLKMGKQHSSAYDDVELMFELLITLTEHEKFRYALGENDKVLKCLSDSWAHLTKIIKKEYEALQSLISLAANLLVGCPKVKKICL